MGIAVNILFYLPILSLFHLLNNTYSRPLCVQVQWTSLLYNILKFELVNITKIAVETMHDYVFQYVFLIHQQGYNQKVPRMQ